MRLAKHELCDDVQINVEGSSVCGTVGGKHSISLATETMEKKTINICHHLHPASNHSWPLPALSILTEYAWLSPAAAETG